jgi:hypothetical protein
VPPMPPANRVVDPQDDILVEIEKIARMEDVFVVNMIRDPYCRAYLVKVMRKAQEEIRGLRNEHEKTSHRQRSQAQG